MIFKETEKFKAVVSPEYNYLFNKINGAFIRHGATEKDDPDFSPFGPELADIEISTICSGVNHVCSFCYKSNTPMGSNMSLDTFKTICDKLPKTVTQIAFGIGDVDANPDMLEIFKYSRAAGFIPNVTINGARLTDQMAKDLANICGAIAVSLYDFATTEKAVSMLHNAGLKQINIHKVTTLGAVDTYKKILEAYQDPNSGYSKVNAVVFLAVKQKGRAENISNDENDKMQELFDLYNSYEKKPGIGFDSCSCHNAKKVFPDNELTRASLEPCESTCFSIYINVDGLVYPCSFMENVDNWKDIKISMLEINDFIKDVWENTFIKQFRDNLILTGRKCPKYFI